MRLISRSQFILLVTCLSLGTVTTLNAQNTAKPGKGDAAAAKPPAVKQALRGDNANPGIRVKAPSANQELPPDLEDLLRKWEESSSKIKSLYGDQTRSEYNPTFKVEKRSQGKFFLETPDKGRIDMLAVKLKKGEVSKKEDEKGKPYELETGQSERWICTGDAIMVINEDDHTYLKEEIPEEQQGSNIVHSPLPFLFGMKAEEAKSRYKLALIQSKKGFVTISAIPLWPQDQQNYEKAIIVLDTTKYLPRYVRLQQGEKGSETVYTFENVQVNEAGIKAKVAKIFGVNGDPYHPSLKGYTLALPPEDKASPIKPAAGKKESPKPQSAPISTQKKDKPPGTSRTNPSPKDN